MAQELRWLWTCIIWWVLCKFIFVMGSYCCSFSGWILHHLLVFLVEIFILLLEHGLVMKPSFIFTYLITATVVGAPLMTFQPFFSFFLCSALHSWTWQNSRPVHLQMLSSHLFFCLLCLLPPFTVPWKMILVIPDEQEICPYHFTLCLFTMVRKSLRSSWQLNLGKDILVGNMILCMWCVVM